MANKSKKKALPIIIALILVCAALIVCAVLGVFDKKGEKAGKTDASDTAEGSTEVVTNEKGETVTANGDASAPSESGGAEASESGSGAASGSNSNSGTNAGSNSETAQPVGEDEKDVDDIVDGNGAVVTSNNNASGKAETGVDAISGNTGKAGNTDSYSYSFDKKTDEGVPPEGGKISMELNYPVFESSTVNVSPLNDAIAAKAEATKDAYARMFASSDEETTTETYCRYTLTSKIAAASDKVVSVLLTTNTAIGTGSRDTYATVNYDLAAGKTLNLYDLFPEDADYETVISGKVGAGKQIDAGKFLLSKEGLTVFAISAGSEPTQVTIPFSALDGLIIDAYKIS